MAKKEGEAAAPAAEKKYPNLSSNFLAPRATFKGRLKAVMKAYKDAGNNAQAPMVQDFRQALSDQAIPAPTERVSHQQAKQLALIGIELPPELLPNTPEPKAAAEGGAAADVTAAV